MTEKHNQTEDIFITERLRKVDEQIQKLARRMDRLQGEILSLMTITDSKIADIQNRIDEDLARLDDKIQDLEQDALS